MVFDHSSSSQHNLIYIFAYLILERYGFINSDIQPALASVCRLILKWLQEAHLFFVLAGPNVIEYEEHIMYMAKQIKAIATKFGLPLLFKPSFEKSNMISSKSFGVPGLAEGLKGVIPILFEVGTSLFLVDHKKTRPLC